jgi:autotransporter-associated beta strand protein
VLRLRSLVMNGGLIDTSGPGTTNGGTIRLMDQPNVRIEARSTATQMPVIRGPGTLVLEGRPEIGVHKGPLPIDLRIETAVLVTAGQGLEKSGDGVAQFALAKSYSGTTDVEGGTLLIDGVLNVPITVHAAATLGGSGATGAIRLDAARHSPPSYAARPPARATINCASRGPCRCPTRRSQSRSARASRCRRTRGSRSSTTTAPMR